MRLCSNTICVVFQFTTRQCCLSFDSVNAYVQTFPLEYSYAKSFFQKPECNKTACHTTVLRQLPGVHPVGARVSSRHRRHWSRSQGFTTGERLLFYKWGLRNHCQVYSCLSSLSKGENHTADKLSGCFWEEVDISCVWARQAN